MNGYLKAVILGVSLAVLVGLGMLIQRQKDQHVENCSERCFRFHATSYSEQNGMCSCILKYPERN